MSTDLTLPDRRHDRDALADRVDVLDKVKALTLLPGDAFATTDLVAGYYEVAADAIRQLVVRNSDELISDGQRVLRGNELSDVLSLASMDRRTSALAVFPRRAILRVGMLLRDSLVAKAVRDHLLDAERTERPAVDVAAIDRSMLARWVIEAEDRAKAAEAHVAILEAPAAAWVAMVDATGDYSLRDAAQILDRDPHIHTGQNRLGVYLRQIGWIDRYGIPYQRHVDVGRVRSKAQTRVSHRTGERVAAEPQLRITLKGLGDLHRLMHGAAPLALDRELEAVS